MSTKILNRTKAKYVAEINEAELAARIYGAITETHPPDGKTWVEALAILDDDERSSALRAARAAMIYWSDCITNANRSN